MLDVHDFGPNPHVPDYGTFGAVTVRRVKGTAASGPRRRTVLSMPEFDRVLPMLQARTSPGHRGRFQTTDRSAALWPTDRGDRVALGSPADSFAAARTAAGLSGVGEYSPREASQDSRLDDALNAARSR